MLRSGAGQTIFVLTAAGSIFAQKVISAKAGFVYRVWGHVSVVDSGLLDAASVGRQLKHGDILSSGRDGLAEVLLNPGAVLRLGNTSRLQMEDNTLSAARLSLESGSAVVTVTRVLKAVRVEMDVAGGLIVLTRPGVYRCDAQPGRLRVYRGLAEAQRGSAAAKVVRPGQSVLLADLQVARFNRRDADGLNHWAERQASPGPGTPAVILRSGFGDFAIYPRGSDDGTD
jgi:hypothetical protein